MRRVLLALALLMSFSGAALAQTSPRAVVQKFYSAWHKASEQSNGAQDKVLTANANLFDKSLLALIRQVEAIARANTQQVEGYDCDPFFDTQDSVFSFRVGPETIKDGLATVPVYAVGGRKKAEGPERKVLTVQLRRQNGDWHIMDMIYNRPGTPKDANSLAKWSGQILEAYHNRKK